MMSRLLAALTWSGTDATMSMFAIFRKPVAFAHASTNLNSAPERWRAYEMSDEAGILGGRYCYEYDLTWEKLPHDIEGIVREYLQAVLGAGAVVAWFGFEGSFDFEYILHPAVADQIYGAAGFDMLRLALHDEVRAGLEWRNFVDRLRVHPA